jgi:hypothetical protein
MHADAMCTEPIIEPRCFCAVVPTRPGYLSAYRAGQIPDGSRRPPYGGSRLRGARERLCSKPARSHRMAPRLAILFQAVCVKFF